MSHFSCSMRILHTSDWHLGRTLYGRRRYEEHQRFLTWLCERVEEEQPDALLVAGDVFDTSAPGNRAQELYYDFLSRVAESPCRLVVITGGNHDSPAFLNAPRQILRSVRVHVVGCMSESLRDEVLVLCDYANQPQLVVCAVPYLRDRDVRTVEPGETVQDKARKLLYGIQSHYAHVLRAAARVREGREMEVPVVAMGHLFTQGARTVDGDGVRELYVGSLAHVDAETFPPQLADYVALGHLHIAQEVGNDTTRRYCGSPIPIGFEEAGQEKCILKIDFDYVTPVVSTIPVPVFQRLAQLRGSWEEIAARITALRDAGESAWLEVVYEGDEIAADLRERVESAVAGSALEVLRVKNTRVVEQALRGATPEEDLQQLGVSDVFARCLDEHEVPEEQREELEAAYAEIVSGLAQSEEDTPDIAAAQPGGEQEAPE